MTTRHTDVADALRKLADLVEAASEVRPMSTIHVSLWSVSTRKEMAALARAALSAGCKVDKDISASMYNLELKIGPLTASALAFREQVCERVVVGTREVTEMVPDPALPAPPMVEQTRTEDVVEWRCTPLLAPVKDGAA